MNNISKIILNIYEKNENYNKNKNVLSSSSLWRNFFMPRLPFLLSTTISIK
jgi:hypothetical protein